ncbi:tetratricopeptide repeat protein 1 [Cheilinus undulatus]|uniref:tetratricopeptide repeat protein 1 n=1 Tax=Cheilinus undulatus TaxID=241271 RepID=UPI001BD23D93|nr:tetratricopeptide repeat protein 1 [Cheilinus undulatus]
MSSRKPQDQEDEQDEEEDFYDCEETHHQLRGAEEETAGASKDLKTDRLTDRSDGSEREGRIDEDKTGEGMAKEYKTGRKDFKEKEGRIDEEQRDNGLQDNEREGDELQSDETKGNGLQDDETKSDGLQDDETKEDSDSEFKEVLVDEVEFDDDYLREVEKELTEEEKESRRQQSLTLKEQGNAQFKSGDWEEAERSYKEALGLCPICFSKERAVLFSNRAAARLHLDLKEKAISDCSRAIELNPDYVRALLRRAELYEQTEKLDEALEDYKKVLELDPNQTAARQACMRLPGQIQERNEKLKEEMISKLKDLGNLVLRPFGLSTRNFQVNQDAATGSYSINFVQSPGNNNNNNT